MATVSAVIAGITTALRRQSAALCDERESLVGAFPSLLSGADDEGWCGVEALASTQAESMVLPLLRSVKYSASYTSEVERITQEMQERRPGAFACSASVGRPRMEGSKLDGSDSFIPCIYRRRVQPLASDAWQALTSASKLFELNLRFHDIERLDSIADSLILQELNQNNTRDAISFEEYCAAMEKCNKLIVGQLAHAHGRAASTPGSCDPQSTGAASAAHDAAAVQRGPKDQNPEDYLRGTSTALDAESGDVEVCKVLRHMPLIRLGTCGLGDMSPLVCVPYISSIPPPQLTKCLYLSCPRNTNGTVDVSQLFLRFGKHVSLLKTEAELMLCDTDNDGCLTEDEVEMYVRNLVPTIVALRGLREEILPFYCCAVSRRILWTLDPGNRGCVRIDHLLHCAVMDEWLDLQLMTEDSPRNWFGASITAQLYDKFLMLDTRNEGMLNVDNMKRYKKGIPTVLDDGLPLHTSPLSSLFIDRFFETTAMMAEAELDFRKFVDFVIAVEFLPQCSRPVFLWNILDITGEGVLTPMTFNAFFKETHAKLIAAGVEAPPAELVVVEAFDLIATAEPLRITRKEFIASPQAGLFTALLIDCLSFWTYENREPR